MTSTGNQAGLYILRLLVVGVAFVGLPSLPILVITHIPEGYRWLILIWLPFAFWIWSRIAQRLLVAACYVCPGCGRKIAKIEITPRGDVGDVFLACPGCGFREKTDIAWY